MVIGKPEIVQRGGDVSYRVRVQFADGEETLWYSFSREFADLVSDRADAALVAMLLPAMERGEDIRVEGTISEKLHYHLSGPYQHIMRLVKPELNLVQIRASRIEPSDSKGRGVATGFSAGIDSFCTLADHHYTEPPPGYRITHLLYNNVGSHSEGAEQLFRERYSRLLPSTEQMGLPFVAVNSNLDRFNLTLDFQLTHTARNTSVALLLQRGIRRFMYASATDYSKTFVGPNKTSASTDVLTLPMLSTESMEAFSVGGNYTRVQKTVRVSEIEESYRSLDVCIDGSSAENCSRCYKCKRTMITLEIAGALDRYADVFDLALYRARRYEYLREALDGRGHLEREVLPFAAERGFRFPLGARIQAHIAYRAARRGLMLPIRTAKGLFTALTR